MYLDRLICASFISYFDYSCFIFIFVICLFFLFSLLFFSYPFFSLYFSLSVFYEWPRNGQGRVHPHGHDHRGSNPIGVRVEYAHGNREIEYVYVCE